MKEESPSLTFSRQILLSTFPPNSMAESFPFPFFFFFPRPNNYLSLWTVASRHRRQRELACGCATVLAGACASRACNSKPPCMGEKRKSKEDSIGGENSNLKWRENPNYQERFRKINILFSEHFFKRILRLNGQDFGSNV